MYLHTNQRFIFQDIIINIIEKIINKVSLP